MQKLSWPTVGLIGLLGAIAVALSTLAHWSSDQILAVIGVLGGLGGSAAVAGGVGARVDQLHAETAAQTPVLQQVERRLNGEFDGRVAEIVRRVMREEGGR